MVYDPGQRPVPEDAGANVGDNIGDRSRSAFQSHKVRFKVDADGLRQLNTQFNTLNTHIGTFKREIGEALDLAREFNDLAGGMSFGGGTTSSTIITSSGGATSAGGIPSMPNTLSTGSHGRSDYMRLAKMFEAHGLPVHASPRQYGRDAMLMSKDLLKGIMATSAANIKGRADYTLEADRTGLLMRQMYGGTQLEYQSRWRQPTWMDSDAGRPRLLGPGGVATMMSLQTTMGINPASMAAGVEGIRVASGFGYSTDDATRMITAMAQPGSSNLMTMMLGTGMYGPGGKPRDPMDVIRTVVQRMGLTNAAMVKGAFQPGSMTRANLARTGLPMDMQNLVLQYAQENLQFQDMGGSGMYRPEDDEHRKIMGIDSAYAMERERTSMAEVDRAEEFYREQVDNYAQLEKNTRDMINIMNTMETWLKTLVGYQASLTGHPVGRIAVGGGKAAGMGLQIAGLWKLRKVFGLAAGLAAAPATGGASLVSALSLFAGGKAIEEFLGDDPSEITQSGMDAGFKGNLRAMAKAAADEGIPLSLVSGVRDPQHQRELFLERHDEDPNGNRSFEGKKYSLNAVGEAKGYAAPPGSSLHEVGLAADLGPESSWPWIKANVARFGLRTARGEDWHVSPAGMTRAKYNATHPQPSTTSSGGGSRAGAQRVGGSNLHSMTKDVGISPSIKIIEDYNASRGDDGGGGGAVVTIAPVIHLNGSGNDAADAQRLAQKVIHMIETAEAVRSLRRS